MLDYKIDAILQTYNIEYVYFVLEYLRSVELLIVGVATSKVGEPRGTRMVRLTPRGIMRAEELIGAHAASVQGFVAMWFTDETTEAWDKGFYPAIDAAGYEPHRIDKTEHVNKICDEIVAEIRKSRFIVADFTGQRGGVYFEAGYALGRGIPVIWTCRKDDLSNLHFDIRQYNCIDWETPEELAQRLQARIEAVIGEGPRRSLIRVGGTAGEKDRSR